MPRRRRLRVFVSAALSVCFAGTPAVAQTRQLHWNPALDVTVTSIGAAGLVASEVFVSALAASHCRWCNVDSVDAGVRDALIWRNTAAADTISDVTGFVLMPLAALGLDTLAAIHDGVTSNVPEDALLIAEATVIAADVTQVTKLLVGRERPFVHALSPDQKAMPTRSFGDNVSFFSGHTSEAFALAAASGTLSEERGYRWAPVTWSVGVAIAATTAYLRIAADRHWLTDVVVGAVVGAGLGFAIPYAFHSAVDESPRASFPSAALRMPAPAAAPVMTVLW